MITYFGIATVLFFAGIVLLVVIDCLEDWGWMLLLCVLWPATIFGGLAVGVGALLKKALRL